MSEQIITIEKMAFGGAGLGHAAGKVCFVPFTAPGDRAKIRVTSQKRSFMEGELSELLTPSPHRTVPRCPIFGSCGGCNWQHLAYPVQLEYKEEIFSDLLWRFGRVECSRILPIIAAPEPYAYRARVQFKVRNINGAVHIGFFRAGSHRIVDIPGTCAISQPAINQLFPDLHSLLSDFRETDKIPQIDVTVGDDGSTFLIFHYTGDRHEDLALHLEKQRRLPQVALYIQIGRKSSLHKVMGLDSLAYHVPRGTATDMPPYELHFSPASFSQVNYRQNLALIEKVVDWAGLTGAEKVLDLYCGNGNFSIPLSGRAASVTGIEGYPPSIADASRNSELNSVKNTTFRCADAVTGLLDLITAGDTFDTLVLDPPRAGAADLVRHIPSVKPSRILYISCDPATLARDIGSLCKAGYEVVKSQPIDMFPQTYHIESVTLLVPKNSDVVRPG